MPEANQIKEPMQSLKHPNPNDIINQLSHKLELSYYTRSVALSIYHFYLSKLKKESNINFSTSDTRKIAHTALLIAIKSTDALIDLESFHNATSSKIDVDLELEIASAINFDFNFFDAHGFVKDLCMFIGDTNDLEQKIDALDNVFYSDRILNFGIAKGPIDPVYLSLSVFTDKELEIFEAVNFIAIDKDLLFKAREIVRTS